MDNLKPMDAVAALYAGDDHELAAAIVGSLSRTIFEGSHVKPAGTLKKVLARLSHRVMQLTTRSGTSTDENGAETIIYSNRLLERSKHPYAKALLNSSSSQTAALVEGGDPMNGPYMMLSPEIRKNCGLWDRLFFDSVQSRDVQSRIIWETRATYEAARRWLEKDEPVRLKAVAAGTGLSMMLAYDRLLHDGFNPALITALITDRDHANIAKANCLLDSLARARGDKLKVDWRSGISAAAEDIFAQNSADGAAEDERYDIVTAIGILEYFQGHTYTTTEQKLRIAEQAESATAHDLIARLTQMTTDRASLIVNTYRDHASTRILELFGKRFDYRSIENVRALLASANFRQAHVQGSGNIYDVKVYHKNPFPAE
jgi:hypothetical protein